jgi:hypothetical protein
MVPRKIKVKKWLVVCRAGFGWMDKWEQNLFGGLLRANQKSQLS